MMTADIQVWWAGLSAVAVCNLLLWSLTAKRLHRRRAEMSAETFWSRRIQLVLCGVYVLGCAYRSVLPVYDVPRLVVVDSWLSSVAIGRSVATLAEVCFVAQMAVLLNEFSRAAESAFARRVSLAVVPLILIAEVCSWYAVLTRANIGHVIEESIWGLTAALLIAGVVAMRSRVVGALRQLLDGCCVVGIVYVAYMLSVDVPMYWSRWIADEAAGRAYLTPAQGWIDIATRWTASHRWEDWQSEVVWMSLYFGAAVWLSILLINAPVAQWCVTQVKARQTSRTLETSRP